MPRTGPAGVLAALLLAMAPVPASALYKCVAEGRTSFQELPCGQGARQTEIRAPNEAQEPPFVPSVAPAAAAPPSSAGSPPVPAPGADQLRLDAMEAERLRRDAAYALRDKLSEYQRTQAACERDHGVVFTRNADADRSISSAVYPQNAMDGNANLAAARCIAKVNELQQQLGAARAQCAVRKCE